MTNKKTEKDKYIRGDIKKVNYTKEEFECLLNCSKGYFKNHIDKYEDYYNLNREELKGFGIGGQYNIPYLTAPLIKIMLGNITENPYRDGRLAKVEDRKNKKERYKSYSKDEIIKEKKMILEDGRGLNLDKIIKYNELIIKGIEDLPTDIKEKLKKNTTYEFNYVLNEVIPLILDRFSILFSLIISQSSVSAGNSYIDLINALDSWIRNFAIHSIDHEENRDKMYREEVDSVEELKNGNKVKLVNVDTNRTLNSEVDKSYIIDSVLREEYYRNLNLAKVFDDKVKENGLKEFFEYIGYEGDYNNINKNEINRYKLLEWIGQIDKNYNKKSRQNIAIVESRLVDFKSKVRSIDRIRNGKTLRVDFYKKIMKSIVKSVSKDPIMYRDRIIDDAVGFIEPRELGIMMSRYLKRIIRLNSYNQSIVMGTVDVDPSFDRDLELYATKLWEEFDCRDKKKEKQIEKLINQYYEKLRNGDVQISKTKLHLTKAIEEMIIPKLIDEINNL